MKMVHSLTGSISPRVYKLLKTTDLNNLTDDETIEVLNREEMRRLVLVQLARLSVKQEWDGLLG